MAVTTSGTVFLQKGSAILYVKIRVWILNCEIDGVTLKGSNHGNCSVFRGMTNRVAKYRRDQRSIGCDARVGAEIMIDLDVS